jgi:CRISPR-associated protein Csm4
MQSYRARIKPLSAFGTRPLGDTLFGQLCWALRNRHGEQRLAEALAGYTQGQPYAVISDALPPDHWPRPSLPVACFRVDGEDRKAVKKLAWLPAGRFDHPVREWLAHSLPPGAVPGAAPASHPQPHNTLNRETGATGTGQFAPYAMDQWWFDQKPRQAGQLSPAVRLDIYVVLDEERLSADELRTLLDDMGAIGFGRDASIGLGKFAVEGDLEPVALPSQPDADAWLTLAPCAPQGGGFDPARSFYQPFTRFGRHGDLGVHLPGGPFKAPVLLAQTGAVLAPSAFAPRLFVGRGLGGEQEPLSKAIRETVQQGYAPALGIRLPPLSG